MFWAEIGKISEFYLKTFSFWRWNFQYIWIGVFSLWCLLLQLCRCVLSLFLIYSSFASRRIASWLSPFMCNFIYIWASAWQNLQNCMCAQRRQISLGIRPVWSESSLGAQWVAKDPSFLHAESEDSDQTGRMPGLIRESSLGSPAIL